MANLHAELQRAFSYVAPMPCVYPATKQGCLPACFISGDLALSMLTSVPP